MAVVELGQEVWACERGLVLVRTMSLVLRLPSAPVAAVLGSVLQSWSPLSEKNKQGPQVQRISWISVLHSGPPSGSLAECGFSDK